MKCFICDSEITDHVMLKRFDPRTRMRADAPACTSRVSCLSGLPKLRELKTETEDWLKRNEEEVEVRSEKLRELRMRIDLMTGGF